MKQILSILLAVIFITSCVSRNVVSVSKKPQGVLVTANNVEIANSLLKADKAKNVFETKIGKEIMFFPKEQAKTKFVYCFNNGLIQTLQECYDNHRPLILTPDAIWLSICQGVSIHINEHYDSLKNIIFITNKPDKIIIRNDSLSYSAKHWKKLIEDFSTETGKYTTNDFYSFFVPEFTTTSAIEKTAYQITMLECYKKAFEYIGETGCGIPTILLAGKTEDWQTILQKLDMLNSIGLSEWADVLRPIILEFIAASEGKQNPEFWGNIYKNATEYGAFYVSGWIIKFFPYIKELEYSTSVFDEKTGNSIVEEKFTSNTFYKGDDYLMSTLSTDNFPSGIANIPVTWNNYSTNTFQKVQVYAGFFAIKQYADKSLEPLISWVICEENAKIPEHKVTWNTHLTLQHNSDYWSPYFIKNISDSAVYDIKKFKTQANSIAYIKQLVLDSLQKNSSFQPTEYIQDTIEIKLFSNGKIAAVTLLHSNNAQLTEYISNLLTELPEVWFPALAYAKDIFLELMDTSIDKNNIKVRVNSIVTIGL